MLGLGTWPSLSLDGVREAYSWSDGLHIVDLDSGENRLLPGTTDYDYNPRWSPDSLQLAFVRIVDIRMGYVIPLALGAVVLLLRNFWRPKYKGHKHPSRLRNIPIYLRHSLPVQLENRIPGGHLSCYEQDWDRV